MSKYFIKESDRIEAAKKAAGLLSLEMRRRQFLKMGLGAGMGLAGLAAIAGQCGGPSGGGAQPTTTTAVSAPTQRAETSLEKAKRQGYVVVGFANEKPFDYATPDGKLTGACVEVSRVILQRLGIGEMQGVLTEFGSLIPGLLAKRFDIATAGMWITPERAKQVAFANPEFKLGEAIVVKKGNPYNLHSYKDIVANPKIRIAVQSGFLEKDYLLANGVAENNIVIVPDQPSQLEALKADRVEVIASNGPGIQAMLDTANDPSVERVMDFKQPLVNGKEAGGYSAAAFRKEDQDFVDAYNRELDKLKQSGELLKIQRPFAITELESSGDVTAEQLSH